jgi:hypothetical protein
MLIEYKIKFEQDGVSITQRVEPDASDGAPVAQYTPSAGLAGRSLGKVFGAHPGIGRGSIGSGGEGAGSIGPGGEGAGSIGPGGAGPEDYSVAAGGEGAGSIGPGGTGPGARPMIILGPVVMGAPARTQASGVAPIAPGKPAGPETMMRRPAVE